MHAHLHIVMGTKHPEGPPSPVPGTLEKQRTQCLLLEAANKDSQAGQNKRVTYLGVLFNESLATKRPHSKQMSKCLHQALSAGVRWVLHERRDGVYGKQVENCLGGRV